MRSDRAQERSFIERARRRQLVDAAIEQLAESGYAGTSLAAVAARAGLSKPAVLYHFTGGKDELLSEVVASVIDSASVAMAAEIEAEATMLGKLRTYITANVRYLAEHRRQILALMAVVNGAPHGPNGETVYEPIGERAVLELAGLLQAGQRAGEFGGFSAIVVARSLRGAIDALAPVLRHEPEADFGAYAAELVRMFERVVAP